MTTKEIFNSLLYGLCIVVLVILIILIIYWLLVVKPKEDKKEKKEELERKKERQKIAEQLNNHCYFCEASLTFDSEEVEEMKRKGQLPFCYTCAGKLERWDKIKF